MYQPAQHKKLMMMRLWTVTYQECCLPWFTFFLEAVELAETLPPVAFLPPWQASVLLSKWSLFAKEAPLDWHKSLLHIEMEPCIWSGFATFYRRNGLRQAHGRLLQSLCRRPVYMAIQASLTRRSHILETMKKGELWSPDLITLPESRIKNMC